MGFLDTLKEKIIEYKNNFFITRKQKIDEALIKISDPFAKEISWEYIVSGGINFKTHNLVKNLDGNYEYNSGILLKIIIGLTFFVYLILSVPLSSLLIVIINTYYKNYLYTVQISYLTIGILYFILIFFLFKKFYKKKIFDLNNRCFYEGKLKANYGLVDLNSIKPIYFKDIYAIQILGEYVMKNKSNYYSYEINLVLNNKERINLIDHSDKNSILSDAKIIGEFIGVPVWDLSEVI